VSPTWESRLTDPEDVILELISSALWEEYAAHRVGAIFNEEQTVIYQQSLNSVLSVSRNPANAAIRSYRVHGDVSRVLEEAGYHICEPLRIAAYLFGHLDGLNSDFDLLPRLRDQPETGFYGNYLERLWGELRALWARRDQWQSRAEFDFLKGFARGVGSRRDITSTLA
jgi:hypothetical protein